SGGGLDTLDFYLFRKEDNTEFPVVQVRPGPSKVSAGDQVLLTGDRKREEQIALLASHPIKCQNTTGKLTFTFWVYNGARIEVLILEDREDEGLHALPEKPQIDCGTVEMNTECSVSIPPNLQPFQLGLRAYDIRNTEGSFVMLDSINYEAQFCKVSTDFGPMTYEPLLTGARGQFVNAMAELNCDQFGATCRWRQSTNIEPDLPSAFLYIEEGSGGVSQHNNVLDADTTPNEFRMLISDPIHCVGPSSIDLKFRIWATKGIKLSVCLIEAESLHIHISNRFKFCG
uniref:MAM domain-containing protein n=1 Tax=Globodera pallida TaxID=36090 RepID=A0A183CQR1_GLOPA